MGDKSLALGKASKDGRQDGRMNLSLSFNIIVQEPVTSVTVELYNLETMTISDTREVSY